ncbi:hypothetical protein HDU93_000326 [Gonapodya sp. JEL0774]|nr:hypothetical protein HDU93_000326 [Gonapodya sp. JEL0774]
MERSSRLCTRRALILSNLVSLFLIAFLLPLAIKSVVFTPLVREPRAYSPTDTQPPPPIHHRALLISPNEINESPAVAHLNDAFDASPNAVVQRKLVISVLTSPRHIARALAVQRTWKRIAMHVSERSAFGWTVDVRFVLGRGAIDRIAQEHMALKDEDPAGRGLRLTFRSDKLPKDSMIDPIPDGRDSSQHMWNKTGLVLDGLVESDNEDTEGSLVTHRVFWTLSWMNRNWPNADFYMKCDDDTFVVVENLVRHLNILTRNTSVDTTPLFLGRVLQYPREQTAPLPFASGGAGYLLNRAALVLLTSHPTFPISTCYPNHPSSPYFGNPGEDVATAYCLARLDVQPRDVAGMYYAQPEGVIRVIGGGGGFGDERGLETFPISWHWLQQAGRMGEMEWLLYGAKVWNPTTENKRTNI